jgi:2',3'-cyclic-nucleotide 2'-phosphodiesterase (5'-nucleotidase family)
MRSHETNTGNLIADLMRKISKSDLALINGGTFRADKIFNTGLINAKDVYNLIPYNDKIVSVEIDGKTILEALENGVANWGRLKGGFPQVSGIKFEFDPERPNYNKIIKSSVEINGKPIKLNKKYKLSANEFLVKRGEIDGYTMIQGKEVLGEHGLLTDVFIEYIRNNKTISPTLDQRIVIFGTDTLNHYKCGAPDQVF